MSFELLKGKGELWPKELLLCSVAGHGSTTKERHFLVQLRSGGSVAVLTACSLAGLALGSP